VKAPLFQDAPPAAPPATGRAGPARETAALLALLALYLGTRLWRLDLLPMPSDEGTYLTWGLRALYARGPEDWLASLEDGKQPLLAWLMVPFLALWPDRLVAGRLTSVGRSAAPDPGRPLAGWQGGGAAGWGAV